MHYFAYIFKLGIFENQKNITLASQWPLKVVQIHMTHPVHTKLKQETFIQFRLSLKYYTMPKQK